MRFRLELFLASTLVILACGMARHVARADGVGWDCAGTTNCASVPCTTQPGGEYSCGMISPIDHGKCTYTAATGDCCNNKPMECAEIVYHAGGPCEGDPPHCVGEPIGESDRATEIGCDDIDNDCGA